MRKIRNEPNCVKQDAHLRFQHNSIIVIIMNSRRFVVKLLFGGDVQRLEKTIFTNNFSVGQLVHQCWFSCICVSNLRREIKITSSEREKKNHRYNCYSGNDWMLFLSVHSKLRAAFVFCNQLFSYFTFLLGNESFLKRQLSFSFSGQFSRSSTLLCTDDLEFRFLYSLDPVRKKSFKRSNKWFPYFIKSLWIILYIPL